MDAKARANFINSVGGGQQVPCPGCGVLNKADSRFCITCGTPMQQAAAQEQTEAPPVQEQDAEAAPEMPFAPVKKEETKKARVEKPVTKRAEKPAPVEEPEEVSVFAEGLPSWDIVPPQVVVRRKKKK
ncbi:hypothetical protein D7Y41_00265 [Anaerotruncus sp. 1XD22-93]|nr:hypothetical protein [Lachnospiraceae bacterium]NBI75372.1 hypothetical protein [Lachnospiraceae bacterium]RKK00823.1 hypothetical protein D7Y41_00265 [Anaerotruncus sp. 1XD22-93]